MAEPLPPTGALREWNPTTIAAVFLVVGMLLGAVLYWGVDRLLMSEEDPSTEVSTASTTTSGITITTTTSVPAASPSTGAQPTEPPAEQPDDATAARAADRRAQSDLRNAFTAARTLATDYEGRFEKNDNGDPIDAAALKQEHPSGIYAPRGGADVGVVSVAVESVDGPNSHIWLVTWSSAGTFFCIGGTTDGGVSRSTGDSEDAAKDSCQGGVTEW